MDLRETSMRLRINLHEEIYKSSSTTYNNNNKESKHVNDTRARKKKTELK